MNLALMWLFLVETGIWPVTISGWFGLFLSVISAGAIVIGWGKMLEKLNGYGKRLDTAETQLARMDERSDQFKLDIQRMLDAQANEVKTMSQIDAKADACFKAVENHQKEILLRFDSFLQKKNEDHIHIRERLTRIEQQVSDNRVEAARDNTNRRQ